MLFKPTSALLFVSLAVSLSVLATTTTAHPAPACNKLHAAFSYRNALYFVYGNGYMDGLDLNGNKVFSGSAYTTQFFHPITAAIGVTDENKYYLYSNNVEEAYPKDPSDHDLEILYYSGAKEVIKANLGNVVVDAAFTGMNSVATYFYGCDFIGVDANSLRIIYQGKNKDVGLPCDLDAAWSSPNHQLGFITKGDQLYIWHSGARTVGPAMSIYNSIFGNYMRSINLCAE